MSLGDIRNEIDLIDKELVALLKKRMDCSLKVAEIKRAQGLEVYHPQREKEIIDKVSRDGEQYGEQIGEIYSFLMSCSRELQHTSLSGDDTYFVSEDLEKDLKIEGDIACYGNVGSFTHLALLGAMGENNISPLFCDTFEKVFESVDRNEVNFGIVPVENSSAGSVSQVYDLLIKYKTYIVGSVNMPVCHNLLSLPESKTEDIKTVYSHHQALSQCEAFIKKIGLEAKECSSTAAAAELVAKVKDKSLCAIGSLFSAKENGLEVMFPSIQSFKGNKTRFIILSKNPIIPKEREKISLVFSLPHTPGSLQKILTRFSLHGLNLTKLESRAGQNGDFETCFYLDFLGDVYSKETRALLSDLKAQLPQFTFLGNYREIAL